jgi:arginase family enzyme
MTRISLLGVPHDDNSSFMKGAAEAPAHIRRVLESDAYSAAGAFADLGFPAPRTSVYDCRCRRNAWVQLPAGVQAFDKNPV